MIKKGSKRGQNHGFGPFFDTVWTAKPDKKGSQKGSKSGYLTTPFIDAGSSNGSKKGIQGLPFRWITRPPGWTCPQCRGINPDLDPKIPKMTHFWVFFQRPKCRALEENPRSQNKSLTFQRGISARARAREAPKIRVFDPLIWLFPRSNGTFWGYPTPENPGFWDPGILDYDQIRQNPETPEYLELQVYH